MTIYSTILFIHVLGAVALLGNSLYSPVLRATIRSTDDLAVLRGMLQVGRRLAATNPLAAASILATGLYLGAHGFWSLAWYQVSLGIFLVNFVLAGVVVKPLSAKLGAAVMGKDASAITQAIDALRWSPRLDLASDALLANDVAVLFIMLSKPSLTVSLAAIAACNGGILLYRSLRRRARRSVASACA
jgi:uncharacterized membrane protein